MYWKSNLHFIENVAKKVTWKLTYLPKARNNLTDFKAKKLWGLPLREKQIKSWDYLIQPESHSFGVAFLKCILPGLYEGDDIYQH